MYSLDDMRDYARMLNFPRPEQAEKDYLQEILLREIYSRVSGERLIFRGGTALAKIYGSGRFSEDLDFVINDPEYKEEISKKMELAIKSMNSMYETSIIKNSEQYKDMIDYKMIIEGPLYILSKHPSSRQGVSIDIDTYEKAVLPPVNMIRTPIYLDIPPYSITTEQIEELFMNKIKAIIERRKLPVRDIYDIWIILRKKAPDLEKRKIKQILSEYLKHNEKFEYGYLVSKVESVGKNWDKEMSAFVSNVPEFNVVFEDVKIGIKSLLFE